MSKLKTKSNNLPSLQRTIVLHLAKGEPQTINGIDTEISENSDRNKSYKSTHNALKSLEKKKLIRKADVMEYNNRKFDRFWLTDEGIINAMLEGTDEALLLENSKKIYPNAKILQCFLEIIQQMNPMILKLASNVIKNKGTMDFADLMAILISDANYESDEKTMKNIVTVLKKYPQEYEQAKILIQQMIEKLTQLIND